MEFGSKRDETDIDGYIRICVQGTVKGIPKGMVLTFTYLRVCVGGAITSFVPGVLIPIGWGGESRYGPGSVGRTA